MKAYLQALGDNLDTKLIDFDNYLDDPSADWLNRNLFESKSRKAH